MSVVQVTSREFRNKQAALFDIADKGEKVIIRRGNKQAYILTPVNDEDFSISLSAEVERRIELSREQYRAGNVTVCNTAEEAIKHLETL